MIRWTPLLLIPALVWAQAVGDADRKRFEEIRARHDRGETISVEDRQFAQGIMQRMNQGKAAQQNGEYARTHPPRESTGLVPLTDLAGGPNKGTGAYKGKEGGLYPGGTNTPPDAHLRRGLELAKQIAPIDGRIVLLTIGMSNTTQESQAFIRLAKADPAVNPQVAIVDGAQGGQTARITANPSSNYWTVADQRLAAANVTPKQVQVVWLKQANAQPTGDFPVEAKRLQDDLEATVKNLHDRYPNLKIVYLSSRIYGGYAVTPLNPEPHAYEGAFAVKWTIVDQIAKGDSTLPWLAWGPYLWGDGMKGRKQDSFVWTREDLGPDGTHPSDKGREKVGKLLLEFLKTDPTAKPWFVASQR